MRMSRVCQQHSETNQKKGNKCVPIGIFFVSDKKMEYKRKHCRSDIWHDVRLCRTTACNYADLE